MLCGNPEEVCEQLQAYQDVGCTVAFGTPDEGFAHEQVLEMIEVFGQQVIPEFDTDPEHSTTKYRGRPSADSRRSTTRSTRSSIRPPRRSSRSRSDAQSGVSNSPTSTWASPSGPEGIKKCW